MVAGGALPLAEAYKAVDLDTLTLLLGMMIVVANLRLSGFFAQASGWVMRRARFPPAFLGCLTSGPRRAFSVRSAPGVVSPTPAPPPPTTRSPRWPPPAPP